MSLPINELIAQNLETALRGVNQVAGYLTTFARVERAEIPYDKPIDLLCVLCGGDVEEVGDPQLSSGLRRFQQTFWVLVFSILGENNGVKRETRLNCIAADVNKAVCGDFYRGGLADFQKVLTPVFGSDSVLIGVDIQFQVNELDWTRRT